MSTVTAIMAASQMRNRVRGWPAHHDDSHLPAEALTIVAHFSKTSDHICPDLTASVPLSPPPLPFYAATMPFQVGAHG